MRLLMIQLLAATPTVPALPAAPQAAVRLNWVAPEECPSEASILHELDRRLAGIPALEQPILVDAEVHRLPEGLFLDLRLYNEFYDEPVRRYQRASCRDLTDMALDEICSVFTTLRRHESEPAPVPVPAPPPPPAPPGNPLDTVRSARKVSGAVRLGGIVGAQRQTVLGGPTVSLGLLGPRWRLELAALYLRTAPSPYEVIDEAEREIHVAWQMTAGQLTACGAAVARDRLELHLCGGGEIGGIFGKLAHGVQIDDSRGSAQLWLAVHAGAMVSIRLHRNIYLWVSPTPVLAFPGAVDVKTQTAAIAPTQSPVDLRAPWLQLRGALGMEIRWGR